ncbi:MAG: GWxTD domain-containing protein, partial [Acidobacteriota bacterium]
IPAPTCWGRLKLLAIAAMAVIALIPVRASATVVGSRASAAWPISQKKADLSAFHKIKEKNLPKEYKEWLQKVDIIITQEEKDIFLRLESDSQRETFMEEFWKHRDPTPGTPENEYKDMHYERLEYANDHFGRDTPRPGWMTDMGRMYILLGEPMDINSLPNTQMAYPLEVWFYHANPRLGIPPFFYLAYYKRNGSGEYRLYSPNVDGPMKLLNPAGQEQAHQRMSYNSDSRLGGIPSTGLNEESAAYDVLQEIDAEVAQVSLSLLPGESGAAEGFPSLRSEMMMADIYGIPDRVMPTARWAYPILTGETEADVRFETLPIQALATALLDPTGMPFLHYAVRTDGARLNLNNYEEKYYVTFGIAGSLTDDQQRVLADIHGEDGGEQIMQATLDKETTTMLRAGPLIHLNRLPAIEGRYNFDLVLENNVSREYGRAEFDVRVPSAFPQQLSSSQPFLVIESHRLDPYDPYGDHFPFQVADRALIPSVDHVFPAGAKLTIFHQIYIPAGSTGSLRVTYRLQDKGGVVIDQTDIVNALEADDYGTVNKMASLDLTDVAVGDYQLIVDVEGDDKDAASLPVRVVASGERKKDFVQAQKLPPPTDPHVAYQRAREYRVTGAVEKGIKVLQATLARVPDFKEGLDLLTELLMEAGRNEEVNKLLTPKLVKAPNDQKLLTTLAAVSVNLGHHYDAIRYYERARLATGQDTPELLNPLASEYYADGQVEKARQLLERSLQLLPNQPEVKRLLDQVLVQR